MKPKIKTLEVYDFCALVKYIAEKYSIDVYYSKPNPNNTKTTYYASISQSVWNWLTDDEGCGVDKVWCLSTRYFGPSDEGTQEELAGEDEKLIGKFLDAVSKEFGEDPQVYYTK